MSIILGAGGVAREVAWLIQEAALFDQDVSAVAFVTADSNWRPGEFIDSLPVLSESVFFRTLDQSITAFIAVGTPEVKARVLATASINALCHFPALVSQRSSMDRRPGKVALGQGVIIYPRASLTTEIVLGDFVHVNPGVNIGHQSRIGAFSTLCPGCIVSGNVVIGSGCFVGAGAVIKEGTVIVDNSVIGAGAVVVGDIDEPGTWIGVPARRKLP